MMRCCGMGADEGATIDVGKFYVEGGIWTAQDPQSGQWYEGAFAVEKSVPRGSSLTLGDWLGTQCATGKFVAMGAPAKDELLGIVRVDVAATDVPLPENFVPGADRPPMRPVECVMGGASPGISPNTMLAIGAVGLLLAVAVAWSATRSSHLRHS